MLHCHVMFHPGKAMQHPTTRSLRNAKPLQGRGTSMRAYRVHARSASWVPRWQHASRMSVYTAQKVDAASELYRNANHLARTSVTRG